MRDGYQRKTKEMFIVVKHHNAIVMCVILIPVHPLVRVALKTVHRVLVIQADKQTVQFFIEIYTET
jgi:hypothetical protein